MARPEFAAAIANEASRKATNTAGWGMFLDKTGPGPNQRVTVTNEDGFSTSHILNASENLTVDEIIVQFLDETIDGVRGARGALGQGSSAPASIGKPKKVKS
jgi:hypothetical protein